MKLTADWLGRNVHVVIDRPLGSSHPDYPDLVYRLNYGELPGTLAADGEPIDAYVLGPTEPISECTGIVIAIVHRQDDIEDKLVVAIGGHWQREDIAAAIAFQEQYFESIIEMAGSV